MSGTKGRDGLKEGRVIKLIGGTYTILGEDGIKTEVRARGKFRHQGESPKVGDNVTYHDDYLMTVYERRNNLMRPPVANVDQALLINSAKEPDFSFNLLDRFLLLIENEDITPVIVVTKIDLLSAEEVTELKAKLAYYESFYDVHYLSSKTKENVEAIEPILKNKISVFAGQTGAGKSSLLNAINPAFNLETNAISKALGRGKHTTRHSELLDVAGGLVADTPGFSRLDFFNIDLENVPVYFVDFFALSDQCKFRACTHLKEPKCKVIENVNNGKILPSRYENYKLIYQEIKDQKPRY